MTDTLTSPDGSLRVELAASEWRASLWVNSPRVLDTASGAMLLDLWGDDWDAAVEWVGEGAVRLALRRFTRDGNVSLLIDPPDGVFRIGAEIGPLSALQASIGPAFERAHLLHLKLTPKTATSFDGSQVRPNDLIHRLMGGPAFVIGGLLGVGHGAELLLGWAVDDGGDRWFTRTFGSGGVAAASILFGLLGIAAGVWMFTSGCRMFVALRAYNRGDR